MMIIEHRPGRSEKFEKYEDEGEALSRYLTLAWEGAKGLTMYDAKVVAKGNKSGA